MGKHVMMVMTNCAEGEDEAFNTWYDNQHLPDVLAIEGFVGATRYRLGETQMSGRDPILGHTYLSIYELDADAPEVSLKALGDAVSAGMVISPVMSNDASVTLWEQIGPRQTP